MRVLLSIKCGIPVIEKNVEFYKKGDYMIARDKYLQKLIE